MMLADRLTDERAAWAGVVGVVLTVLTIVLSVILFDGFDWAVHDLSTLGHVDEGIASDSRLVFNGGLIVTALFGLVFAVGLYRLEERILWRAGAIVYAVSHVTVMWQGVFPAGVPQHNWLSIFPFFVGSLALLGLDQICVSETRLFGIVVLSNLTVGLVGAATLVQTDIEGWAIHETLGVTVFSIVTLLFAARLLGVLEAHDSNGPASA